MIAGMKKYITLALGCVAALAVAWLAWATPLPEEAELLASNTVEAKFIGVQDHPCRFMTALCPDRCDHGTRLATFQVISNEGYRRSGKYGDDILAPGDTAVVDVVKSIPGQPEEIVQTISQLKPGDVVKLTICHYYVKQGQGQYPVRPATSLEKL